jgi:hypothetical protein
MFNFVWIKLGNGLEDKRIWGIFFGVGVLEAPQYFGVFRAW